MTFHCVLPVSATAAAPKSPNASWSASHKPPHDATPSVAQLLKASGLLAAPLATVRHLPPRPLAVFPPRPSSQR